MAPLNMLITLLSIILSVAQASDFNVGMFGNATNVHLMNEKRAFTVDRLSRKWSPWPEYPPDSGCGIHLMHYCFKDERSQSELSMLVVRAVIAWAPAFLDSSLRIQHHPSCTSAHTCICDQAKVDDDTLVIQSSSHTMTTIGYQGQSNVPSRHFLHFNLNTVPGRGLSGLAMIHELGHAFGLHHEHQRPDADDWLDLVCENIDTYQTVKANIMSHPPLTDLLQPKGFDDFNNAKTAEERMRVVCSDHWVAERVAPTIAHYVPYTLEEAEHEGFRIGEGAMDYSSIMNYQSCPSAQSKNIEAYILVKHNWRDSSTGRGPIWPGGTPDPDRWPPKISEGDIDAVKYLYPRSDDQASSPPMQVRDVGADQERAPWQAVEVIIPGVLTTTLRPADPKVSEHLPASYLANWHEAVLWM